MCSNWKRLGPRWALSEGPHLGFWCLAVQVVPQETELQCASQPAPLKVARSPAVQEQLASSGRCLHSCARSSSMASVVMQDETSQSLGSEEDLEDVQSQGYSYGSSDGSEQGSSDAEMSDYEDARPASKGEPGWRVLAEEELHKTQVRGVWASVQLGPARCSSAPTHACTRCPSSAACRTSTWQSSHPS